MSALSNVLSIIQFLGGDQKFLEHDIWFKRLGGYWFMGCDEERGWYIHYYVVWQLAACSLFIPAYFHQYFLWHSLTVSELIEIDIGVCMFYLLLFFMFYNGEGYGSMQDLWPDKGCFYHWATILAQCITCLINKMWRLFWKSHWIHQCQMIFLCGITWMMDVF